MGEADREREHITGADLGGGQPGPGQAEEALWQLLLRHQGRQFHTAKNLAFTYVIRGGEMFVDRRSKSITRATISKAFARVREDTDHSIRGPKALNCFGAPYVWALFAALGVVEAPSGEGKAQAAAPSGEGKAQAVAPKADETVREEA